MPDLLISCCKIAGHTYCVVCPSDQLPRAAVVMLRWAFRLPPLALQAILRHSSKQTTLGYYVDLSSTAADVAKLLAGQ